MVIASLVKEFQLASEINHMKGIVPDDILNALRKKKLGLPGIDTEAVQEKNALMAGEFEVILELLGIYKENDQGKIGKAQVGLKFFVFKNVGQRNDRLLMYDCSDRIVRGGAAGVSGEQAPQYWHRENCSRNSGWLG